MWSKSGWGRGVGGVRIVGERFKGKVGDLGVVGEVGVFLGLSRASICRESGLWVG